MNEVSETEVKLSANELDKIDDQDILTELKNELDKVDDHDIEMKIIDKNTNNIIHPLIHNTTQWNPSINTLIKRMTLKDKSKMGITDTC